MSGLRRRARQLAQWRREGRLLAEVWKRRAFPLLRGRLLVERVLIRLGHRRPLREALGLPAAAPAIPAAQLVLPSSDTPEISVVIPAYGQVGHTLACLASLATHPPRRPFEVIVAEDASGDGRAAELRAVRGLRYLEWEANQGFLRSANRAAAEARGRFLFLLNNDTEVMPGCLDRLADILEDGHPAFPGPVGLAGARLLYPDGWLQESGGILWRDGSAWNWGNRQDPRRAEFRYVREADYVSGAAIMLTREAWDAMGGFDEHFLPAYCEDADLAFRLRAAGFRTLVAPDATVIHHEGVSHGTDTTQGVKAHQVTNTARLFARHQATLAAHQPNGVNVTRARDRAPAGGPRKIVLVADNNVPTPDQDAGSRTMLAFLRALLAQGHAVKFWPLNGLALPGYTEALERLGVEVPADPHRPAFDAWLQAQAGQVDRILLSRPHVAAELLPAIRRHAPGAPVLFYGHDLHHARVAREADTCPEPARAAALRAESARLLAEERAAWAGADLSLYPSEEEAAEVRRLAPGLRAAAITPYALPPVAAEAPEPAGRAGLVFVAGFAHWPNVDAAQWLVREVLPPLRAAHPGLRLALVGANPTDEVRALAGDAVEVTGFVSDEELARRYAGARVAVCPLRFGAGIKLKVVEGLHAGVPLVTTPVGVQGLPGAPCAVEETAPALAAAIARLLADDDAWRAMAAAQRGYVAGCFTDAAIGRELDAAFAAASA